MKTIVLSTSLLLLLSFEASAQYGGRILKKCFDQAGRMYVCGSAPVPQYPQRGATSMVPVISEKEHALVNACMIKRVRANPELRGDLCPTEFSYCDPSGKVTAKYGGEAHDRETQRRDYLTDLKSWILSNYCIVPIVTGKERAGERGYPKPRRDGKKRDPFFW